LWAKTGSLLKDNGKDSLSAVPQTVENAKRDNVPQCV